MSDGTSYPQALRDDRLDLSDVPAHPADLIAEAAESHGDAPAFTVVSADGDTESLSFRQADRLSDCLAAFLSDSLDLAEGDVVAIQLTNGLAFPVVVFGAWKAGLIVTLINPLYTGVETLRQLADSSARVLIAEPTVLDGVHQSIPPELITIAADPIVDAAPGSGSDGVWTLSRAIKDGAKAKPNQRSRCDVALYQYTGGTTGQSKAAVLTATNLLATAKMVDDFFSGFGEPIRRGTGLTALPLYHIFAFLFGILVYVRAGTHNVIVPSPRPLANLRPAFEQFSIDWMSGVDTLYAGLLAEPWFRDAPPKLRFAIAGGAALRPSIAADWEALVGPILEGYGLTESTGIVSCNPPTAARRPGTVGLPVPGADLRVVDTDDQPLAVGEAGELLVRGPQVTQGYLHHNSEAGAALDGGWFRTGDIASLDRDGFLTIRDRKKDMILVSGFNVYPNEVEAVLTSHEGVVEAAVVGRPDDRSGELVEAHVVLKAPPPSLEELRSHCRAVLAAYKVPRRIVVHTALPKSAVGKILRSELKTRE